MLPPTSPASDAGRSPIRQWTWVVARRSLVVRSGRIAWRILAARVPVGWLDGVSRRGFRQRDVVAVDAVLGVGVRRSCGGAGPAGGGSGDGCGSVCCRVGPRARGSSVGSIGSQWTYRGHRSSGREGVSQSAATGDSRMVSVQAAGRKMGIVARVSRRAPGGACRAPDRCH